MVGISGKEGISGKGSDVPKTHRKEHAAYEELQVIQDSQNLNYGVERAGNKTGQWTGSSHFLHFFRMIRS